MPAGRPRRVLVTGAGGFVGSRVALALDRSPAFEVRPTAHHVGAGAIYGRRGLRAEAGNLAEPAFAERVTAGVEAIVHCAYGPEIDDPVAFGRFLRIARGSGVRQVLHLSTAEVYRARVGLVDEGAPLREEGGDYAGLKVGVERTLREASPGFSSVAVLRPSIVYGPFSPPWILRPLRRMVEGGWRPSGDAFGGTCNAVYASDLVDLVQRLLGEPREGVATFNVVGPDRPIWAEYFAALAAGAAEPKAPARPATGPMRWAGALAQRLPPAAKAAVSGWARSSRHWGRLALRVRSTARNSPDPAEMELYGRRVVYVTAALEAAGLGCPTPFRDGMAATLRWARAMGLTGHVVRAADF